jgi:hypothetical protein
LASLPDQLVNRDLPGTPLVLKQAKRAVMLSLTANLGHHRYRQCQNASSHQRCALAGERHRLLKGSVLDIGYQQFRDQLFAAVYFGTPALLKANT